MIVSYDIIYLSISYEMFITYLHGKTTECAGPRTQCFSLNPRVGSIAPHCHLFLLHLHR
jgi:hypothetical protein